MPTWQIYLLGALQILRCGQILPPFPTRKARSLFSYLVLHRNRPLTRDSLAQTLWQDAPETSARKCLRNELWRIRKAISSQQAEGNDYLQANDLTIAFNLQANYWLDVSHFDRPAAEVEPRVVQVTGEGAVLDRAAVQWLLSSCLHSQTWSTLKPIDARAPAASDSKSSWRVRSAIWWSTSS